MLRVLSTPALFSLELTPLCNSRCPGCFNVFATDKHTRSGPLMQRPPLSLDQWCAILDRLAPHAHRFKLTGGEPTLYPGFEAVVDHIRGLGTSLTVFTNGRWISPASLLDTLARTPNLTGLLISLHGAHAALSLLAYPSRSAPSCTAPISMNWLKSLPWPKRWTPTTSSSTATSAPLYRRSRSLTLS
jgi:hypothetical protein